MVLTHALSRSEMANMTKSGWGRGVPNDSSQASQKKNASWHATDHGRNRSRIEFSARDDDVA